MSIKPPGYTEDEWKVVEEARMNKCSLGGDTENTFIDGDPVLCYDTAHSCEPHQHGLMDDILCLHDGETVHGHCPQSPFNNDGSLKS